MARRILFVFFTVMTAVSAVFNAHAGVRAVRVGFFPNVTHAQALIGMADGTFRKCLGGGIKIEPFLFKAGPLAIEALFAGKLDLLYVGPAPAVNGYIKSKGEAVRIIAGSASGGAALVVQPFLDVKKSGDLKGLRIATPQLGNTQDVALRHYLKDHGMKSTEYGGNVSILPLGNTDLLALFKNKNIDGAWTVEPWVTLLQIEGGARVFLEEKDIWPQGKYLTTVLVAERKFLDARPDLVKKWLKAHVELTMHVEKNGKAAEKMVKSEIERLTYQPMNPAVISGAFARLDFLYEPLPGCLKTMARYSYEEGFIQEKPDLEGIYDLNLLNKVLKEAGLRGVS
ncbi:MAG: ABC transporter substrate-binding protein [Bacillota bacterium]